MEQVDRFRACVALVGAVMTSLWGWFGWLVILWAALLALDYVTGSSGARRRGEWTSQKARDGIAHKAGEFKVVAVAGALDLVVGIVLENVPALPFKYSTLLCPLVLVWYILTEAGSILENVEKDGAATPPWLKKAIAWLKGATDKAGGGATPSE